MLIDNLQRLVGVKGLKTSEHDIRPHVTEWRGVVEGRTPAVVQPATTAEVAAVMRYCHEERIAVVPQGGNTGLCAGAVPDDSGQQIVLSLSRLNRIRCVDAEDFSMLAEAGCVLANLQAAARNAGRLFPLSLGAEGSCQIGGNLSTNAGGINVIRYGTARSQVLGLEVVLADGTIWDGLNTLRKNTAGYDLKQLFVGSEGTLGIITAASLKLYPEPPAARTALLAIEDARQAVPLLARLRAELSDQIQAFELISSLAFEYVERHIDGARNPFSEKHDWYVLLEATSASEDQFESALMGALEAALAVDVILAKNAAEADALWHMRHSISEAEKHEAPILKHDISVPVARMPDYLDVSRRELSQRWPETRLLAFGHVGDGNLHYNVALPAAWTAGQREQEGSAITQCIYELAEGMGGSFSAEHGVGSTKRAALKSFADPVSLGMMQSLKQALDPRGILNPGKVI
ncbi:MAG: FAD-binding oxidoreductase [Pseudomonadota bacterium]